MQVRWSPEAADDFAAILNYLQANSSSASQRIADELFSGITKLEEFPLIGRIGREPGTREWVSSPLPYIVVYRVRKEVVEIVRILHGAQRWPR